MARANHTDNGSDKLRITDQFRTRQGMAYELREKGARLTVLIAERTAEGQATEWHVEASSAQAAGASVAHAASTKAEALRRTGVEWAADGLTRGLPSFDWAAVAIALRAVRAI